MTDYEIRTLAVLVAPDRGPLGSELATTITIVDEAAGEFVEVEQQGRADIGKICITRDEWPTLRSAIDTLMVECRPEQHTSTEESQ